VRLANLRSGQLDFIERVAPADVPQLRNDNRFRIAKIVELGYQGITINVAKSDMAQKNPLGKDAKVREAFELSIDREALVKVAMEGEAQAGNQWVAPSNRYYAKSVPVPKRNLERAKQLLKEAGVTNPSFTLMTPTASDAQRIAQVVQAMAKEAGFDVKIQSTEFATALKLQDQGQFEAFVLAWSGRADPDANLHQFLSCKGPLNGSGYCQNDVEARINEARTSLDPKQRAAAYEKIAQQVQKDRPIVYLFHRNWLWAHNAKLSGLRTVPDGMVRVQGLRMN
jgi:peptide/nickel transport system substrate-binding protein